jgi:hypothetical protein
MLNITRSPESFVSRWSDERMKTEAISEEKMFSPSSEVDRTGMSLASCLYDLKPGSLFRFRSMRDGGPDPFYEDHLISVLPDKSPPPSHERGAFTSADTPNFLGTWWCHTCGVGFLVWLEEEDLRPSPSSLWVQVKYRHPGGATCLWFLEGFNTFSPRYHAIEKIL